MKRESRDYRKAQMLSLLKGQPECYFTMGQISRYIGLKATPYSRTLIMELSEEAGNIHKIEVKAANGKMAWGYYYSKTIKQEHIPCL